MMMGVVVLMMMITLIRSTDPTLMARACLKLRSGSARLLPSPTKRHEQDKHKRKTAPKDMLPHLFKRKQSFSQGASVSRAVVTRRTFWNLRYLWCSTFTDVQILPDVTKLVCGFWIGCVGCQMHETLVPYSRCRASFPIFFSDTASPKQQRKGENQYLGA